MFLEEDLDTFIFLIIYFFPVIIIQWILKKKYYDKVFEYTRLSKKKYNKLTWIPRIPGGTWLIWKRKKKLKYFPPEGIKLMDRFWALSLIFTSVWALIIFFSFIIYILLQ